MCARAHAHMLTRVRALQVNKKSVNADLSKAAQRERERERQTETETERQAGKHAGRQTGRQTNQRDRRSTNIERQPDSTETEQWEQHTPLVGG